MFGNLQILPHFIPFLPIFTYLPIYLHFYTNHVTNLNLFLTIFTHFMYFIYTYQSC